jgi:hypothetical protein
MTNRIVSPSLDQIATLRQPLTAGELLVLNYFLEKLPPSWEIYIQPHLNGLQPDFVLIHPLRGIAVYEVKDWNLDALDYHAQHYPDKAPVLMAWNGQRFFSVEKNNPVTKIDLYKEEIYSLYCPRLPQRSGFGAIVAGIIFPFARDEQLLELLRPFRDYYGHSKHPRLYPVIGMGLMNNSDKWSFKKRVLPFVDHDDDRINELIASDLRHWLVESSFTSEQRLPLLDDLTEEQKRIVLSRTKTGYRRIKGCAGSGKSFVLAGRAAQLATEGKKVLVITYNLTLINYLMDLAVRFTQSGKVRNQITALNFHYWCKRVAYESGHYAEYVGLWRAHPESGEPPEAPEAVLKSGMAGAAMRWLEDMDITGKFDAVLVDEGQDFELPWWVTMRQALRPDGEALLCADRVQNIYGVVPWSEVQMAGAGFRGPWNTLSESYRLSQSMCMLAKDFIDEFLPDSENQRPMPVQSGFEFKTILQWWQVDKFSAARNCVDALLDIITKSFPPISYSDLTCIVENEEIGNEIVRLLNDRHLYCIHTFGRGATNKDKYYDSRRKKQGFFKGTPGIKVTTIQSFKGWESKALVVQVGSATSKKALALFYAAITRLKKDDHGCYLTVVSESLRLLDYGKKWPIFLTPTAVCSDRDLISCSFELVS